MNKIVLGFFVIIILGGVGWYLFDAGPNIVPQIAREAKQQIATSSPNTRPGNEVRPGMKLYHNEEYGFAFEYPDDWEIRTPVFGSAVSMFNMDVGPNGSGAVTINITPKEWIENALVKMRARGVIITEVELAGHTAIQMQDKDRISRPATITLVLVDDTFWIDITGVLGYEEGYEQVIESFRFLR